MRRDVITDAAQPELYRQNAFRVTGLRVDAAQRDIRRRQQELEIQRRITANSRQPSPLALDTRSDPDAVREAVHRLRDPQSRLLDELFWFWPVAGDDSAYQALSRGDIAEATIIWCRDAGFGAPTGVPAQGPPATVRLMLRGQQSLALHNLAVLHHALALDHALGLDHAPARGEAAGAEAATAGDAAARWSDALRYWRAFLAENAVRPWLEKRITELRDPRLTAEFSAGVQEALPAMILRVNEVLAVRAVNAGDRARFDDQVAILRSSRFADRDVDAALGKIGEALSERLRLLFGGLDQAVRADPPQGARTVTDLLERARPLLSMLDTIGDSAPAVRDAAHDAVVHAAYSAMAQYNRATDDEMGTLVVLQQVAALAATTASRTMIDDGMRVVRLNLLTQVTGSRPVDDDGNLNCFICAEPAGPVQVHLHVVDTWVPRCTMCAAFTEYLAQTNRTVVRRMMLGALVPVGLWIAGVFPFLVLLLLLAGMTVAAWGLNRGRRTVLGTIERQATQYQAVMSWTAPSSISDLEDGT